MVGFATEELHSKALRVRAVRHDVFFLMFRRPPSPTLSSSSAASDVYKRQSLSLPPHLFPGDEATKARTAASLRPLDTSDAHRDRTKDELWTVEKVLEHKAGTPAETVQ